MSKQKARFAPALLFQVLLFVSLPSATYATQGACSYHEGANCSIGAINGRAVCNDSWLSSVLYGDMEECVGYNASCTYYLDYEHYISKKTTLKSELTTLKAEIDRLKLELSSLDYEEAQAIQDLYTSIIGRGVTSGGLQPEINAIHRDYAQRKLDVSQSINNSINQYNLKVSEYNGICRSYTAEEKNGVCVQNFGKQYQYVGNICVTLLNATPVSSLDPQSIAPSQTPNAPTSQSSSPDPIELCIQKLGPQGIVAGQSLCGCVSGYTLNDEKDHCVPIVATAVNTKNVQAEKKPDAIIKKVQTVKSVTEKLTKKEVGIVEKSTDLTALQAATTSQSSASTTQSNIPTGKPHTLKERLVSPFKNFWKRFFR